MNKEEIYKEIAELREQMCDFRASGRSTSILNEIIDSFFGAPMGTPIEVYDHYELDRFVSKKDNPHNIIVCNTNAREMMAGMIKKRLASEFPNIKYDMVHMNGTIYLYRKTPTLYEENKKRLDKLKQMLGE